MTQKPFWGLLNKYSHQSQLLYVRAHRGFSVYINYMNGMWLYPIYPKYFLVPINFALRAN